MRTKIWALLLTLLTGVSASAQEFKVQSVKTMPYDVSAFISPVRDLNGQPCALLRVEAPADFVFSTPLGIVKRQDEVGEILLYLPNGTKMITIKHPDWGVLRNFRFKSPLESHQCYVMRISCPQPPVTEVHDTLVITHTRVDTIQVKRQRPRIPRSSYLLATVSLYTAGPSWGVMLATLKRHGLFVHAACDFRSTGSVSLETDRSGMPIDGSGVMPYYTGKSRHQNYMFTAGFIHRLSSRLNLLEGAGYGKTSTSWQLADEEGGGYALNRDLCHRGIAAEAGLLWHEERWAVALTASTIQMKHWQLNIGIGIKIGKK